MSRQIFFVAGMHRSGTSFLAQTFSLLGLELPISTQPGAPDNPKGHFESFKIAQYHERLLADMNLSWDTFISPYEDWFSSEYADHAVGELSDIINSEFPGNGPIVLKDPRICLFIPLWQKVATKLGLEDFYVIPLRHPLEVAASLDKRNKISKSRALLIWLAYNLDTERYSRSSKRSFVCFPQWTHSIEQSINKIESNLATNLPKKNNESLLKASNEYDEVLVHNKELQDILVNNEIEKLALDTFNSFLNLIEDPFDSAALSAIDQARTRFNELSTIFAEILSEFEFKNNADKADIEQKLQASQDAQEQSYARADALLQQLSKSHNQVTDLEQQLQVSHNECEQSTAHADALRRQLSASESHASGLENQLQVEVESNRGLQSKINDLQDQIRALTKEYEQLTLEHNRQKLTVFKPIYRNIYRTTGLVLRNTLPATWVDSLKKIAPNPEGIPKRLTYKSPLLDKQVIPAESFEPPSFDSNPDIFVLSIINWDFRFQRPQHIAKGLAESGRRVFYVEMELVDGEPQLSKVSNNLYRARLSGASLGHIQPYTGQPDLNQQQKWVSAFLQLCDAVSSTDHKQVIIQHPFWWQLAQHLSPEFQIVFDCMDDISGFSNTEQFLLHLEHDLLTKCDNLVVSSQHLYNKYKHYQDPVLIRNAADLTHFTLSKNEFVRPNFLKQYFSNGAESKIKVGYVGAIAEWFDTDLVKEVAEMDPSVEFHLCGAVTAREPAELEEVGNIYLHGEISYAEVPNFLHEMDVLIIPFKIVPIIQACDPVKFYEYSAIGKPTVTTDLPELSRASELIFLASTASDFSAQIHKAYKKAKDLKFRKQLQEYASNNTWQHRSEQFIKILEDMPSVSVIILSYGDTNLTKATLHSLYEKGPTYPNLETIIVDNGSSPDAVNDIKMFADKYPNVSIIENGENLGFAKGNNVGLEAATGEYVMLLNNDTVVAPGAIYAMVRHLLHHPAIGAVGPLTNNIGNEAKLFVEYENMEVMRSVARDVTIGYRGIYTPIRVVAYFAAMFRRNDLKTFGLLSEDYGRGMFEDDDHCAMINSKGYICALAEDAYIHHHLSATFSTLKGGEKEKLFEKNKSIFEERWGTWKPHEYRQKRPQSKLFN